MRYSNNQTSVFEISTVVDSSHYVFMYKNIELYFHKILNVAEVHRCFNYPVKCKYG